MEKVVIRASRMCETRFTNAIRWDGGASYPLHQIQSRLHRNSCHVCIFNTRPLPTRWAEQVAEQPESGPYSGSRTWEGGGRLWRAVDAQP